MYTLLWKQRLIFSLKYLCKGLYKTIISFLKTGGNFMLLDNQLQDIFKNCKSIAIVGAKDNPGLAVEHVGRYLISQNYKVIPIHPVRKSAYGIPCYKSLLDLQEAPDIVCLFRNSEACAIHAKEILSTHWRPKVFWMQLGIISEEAGILMANEKITVVQDACIEVEHRRIMKHF